MPSKDTKTKNSQPAKLPSLLAPLVTILILILVVMLVLIQLLVVQSKSRNYQRAQAIQEIATALETYYETHGRYPTTDDVLYSSEQSDGSAANNEWIPEIVGLGLIPSLAHEPQSNMYRTTGECVGNKKEYLYKSDGRDYKLISHCGPEGTWDQTHPLYDPVRPTTSWMTCSAEPACSSW